MSMILKLRMLSDENDAFLREYDVPYDMSLLDLNDFICDDLGYDGGNMSSFFLSDGQWQKLREFTLADMGSEANDEGVGKPVPMAEVMLGQVIRRSRDRLIWQFDLFADRAYYLELAAASEADAAVTYPRVAVSEGDIPPQFGSGAGAAGGSIFDQAMEEFNDFEGKDQYDDEY